MKKWTKSPQRHLRGKSKILPYMEEWNWWNKVTLHVANGKRYLSMRYEPHKYPGEWLRSWIFLDSEMDDLDRVILERTKDNPDFPRLIADAVERRRKNRVKDGNSPIVGPYTLLARRKVDGEYTWTVAADRIQTLGGCEEAKAKLKNKGFICPWWVWGEVEWCRKVLSGKISP